MLVAQTSSDPLQLSHPIALPQALTYIEQVLEQLAQAHPFASIIPPPSFEARGRDPKAGSLET